MMMQLQMQTLNNQDVALDIEDLERMRRAFNGIHVDPRRRSYYRVHLESGQAMLTDGMRLHTVPVKYASHVGITVGLDKVQEVWTHKNVLSVKPDYTTDTFLQWRDIVPKADLGVLCDISLWIPALMQIRGWGWCSFQLNRHETVIQPASADNPGMVLRLPHLMYKGKNVPRVEERIFNPQFIYDVFRNAADLGDTRVFLCVVSQNLTAPLLCRGNNSALLALVLAKK